MTFSINENAFSRRREGTTSMSSSTMEPSSSTSALWKNTGFGGSVQFAGNIYSWAVLQNNGAFNFGYGDFTIEWWQYETDTNGAPRPWAFGPWPQTELGISFENNIILWLFGSAYSFPYKNPVKNTSNHFALVKYGPDIYVYQNGALAGSTYVGSSNFNMTYDLTIGYEGGQYDSQCFAGYMSNFNIVKQAKYTGAFTPSKAGINASLDATHPTTALLPFDSSIMEKSVFGEWGSVYGGYSASFGAQVTTSDLSPLNAPAIWPARYFVLEPVLNKAGDSMIQLSEFEILDANTGNIVYAQYYNWARHFPATDAGTLNSPQNEIPPYAGDGSTGTKWLDYRGINGGLFIDLTGVKETSGYKWYTANDGVGRDLLHWKVWASQTNGDHTTWGLVSEVNEYVTDGRQVEAGTWGWQNTISQHPPLM